MSKGITKEFERAVKEKDIAKVRYLMIKYLKMDPTGVMFEDHLEFVKLYITKDEFYDVHDGEVFERDTSKWTIDMYNDEISKLKNNFSKARILDIIAMGPVIHKEKVERHLRREDMRQEKKAQWANRNVSITLIVVGGLLLGFGLLSIHMTAIVMGAALLTSGIFVYLKMTKKGN